VALWRDGKELLVFSLGFGFLSLSVLRPFYLWLSRMGQISIKNQQEAVAIDFARLREVARAVLEGEGKGDGRVGIALMDNASIHALNKRYLDHDEPTDVLSFPLTEPGTRRLEGDLAIGAEVAQAQANVRGHDVQAELALYVIHGLLHLCGYDDHEDEGRAAMRDRERHYLKLLGLPDIAPREDE
jgi:probable rRNA maturation factor